MTSKTSKSERLDLINGPLFKSIIIYSIPIMLSGILQIAYNAADTVVVGQFAKDSTTALAAVGSNASLMNLFINICLGFSTGANVVVARYYGAGAKNELERAVHTAYAISIISGFIVGAIGFLLAPQFLRLMECPENVFPYSLLYIRIIFTGLVFQMIFNFAAGIVRASGDTKTPFIILVLSGLLNVVLNLILVVFFHLDVAGVAIATVLSNILSAVLITIVLIRTDEHIKLNLKKIKVHKDKLLEIARMGIPSCIQSTTFTLSNVVMQSAINRCGDIVMAACSSASSVENFVYIAMNTFYTTSLVFVGQNHAAKKLKRVKNILFMCLASSMFVGAILAIFVVVFARPICLLYSPKDALVVNEMISRLCIVIPMYLLCGILDVLVGCIRGMGVSLIPMFSSIIGVCGIRLTWILTIFPMLYDKTQSTFWLYLAYPVSWLITDIFHTFTLFFLFRKNKALMPVKDENR